MNGFIEFARNAGLVLVLISGLAALAVLAMHAVDRAVFTYIKYKGLWPVVFDAIAAHARKSDA